MAQNIKIVLDNDIFDSSIISLIDKNWERYKVDDYYENEYDLIIELNSNDITEQNLTKINYHYYRVWHKNYILTEKIELAFRIVVTKIVNSLEYNLLNIRNIFVKNNDKINHTQIKLVKIGLHNYNNKRKKTLKFHLDIHLLNKVSIFKILDLIEYEEYDFYIDERNNNKNFYNSLLLKKEKGDVRKLQ